MKAANGKINVLFIYIQKVLFLKKELLFPFFSTLCLILILTFLNGQVVETNSFGFDNDDEVILVDPFAPDNNLDENGYDSQRPRVCPPGQKLVEKPEGFVCKIDYSLQYGNPRNLPNNGKNLKKKNEIQILT